MFLWSLWWNLNLGIGISEGLSIFLENVTPLLLWQHAVGALIFVAGKHSSESAPKLNATLLLWAVSQEY